MPSVCILLAFNETPQQNLGTFHIFREAAKWFPLDSVHTTWALVFCLFLNKLTNVHFFKSREAVMKGLAQPLIIKLKWRLNFFNISEIFYSEKQQREKTRQAELFYAPYAGSDGSCFCLCTLPQPSCVYAVLRLSVQTPMVGMKGQRCFPDFLCSTKNILGVDGQRCPSLPCSLLSAALKVEVSEYS